MNTEAPEYWIVQMTGGRFVRVDDENRTKIESAWRSLTNLPTGTFYMPSNFLECEDINGAEVVMDVSEIRYIARQTRENRRRENIFLAQLEAEERADGLDSDREDWQR